MLYVDRIGIIEGQNDFLPFIYENLSAVQIDCIDWHYLCIKFIKFLIL